MFDQAPEHDDPDVPAKPRDPRFNPWLVPKSDNVWALVGEAVGLLALHETHFGLRARARRPADEDTHLRVVAGVVSALVHHHLNDYLGVPLAISLSKSCLSRAGRYWSPVQSKMLPTVLRGLAAPEISFAEVVLGVKGNPFVPGRLTTIRAGMALRERIDAYDLDPADLGQDLGQETIILKRGRKNRLDRGGAIEYEDTSATRRLRADMKRINAWLTEAPIDCDTWVGDRVIDPHDRLLRRYFNNGSFNEGGRLFGGFWQNMKGTDRLNEIRIDGERVAALDYGQAAARILYGMANAQPPEGDLYAIPGYEFWRDGIKKVFNAMQNIDGDMTRRSPGTSHLLPRQQHIQKITGAIRAYHAPIAHLLEGKVGPLVMRKESQIIVDLLLHLRELGIVALPVHDAVIVPMHRRAEARSAMVAMFRKHTGLDGVVDEELPHGVVG